MAISHKTGSTGYLTEARGRLPQQYATVTAGNANQPPTVTGLPRIDALLQAYAAEFQAIEDALWTVWVNREIQNGLATGDLLKKLGKLVGQTSTYGYSDSVYRTLIQARILCNISNGLRQDLQNIVNVFYPQTTLQIQEYAPACVVLYQNGIPSSISPYVITSQFLGVAVSAGVVLCLVWSISSVMLTFGSVYNSSFSAGPPPSSTGVNTGFASIYENGFAAGPPVSSNVTQQRICGVVQATGGST